MPTMMNPYGAQGGYDAYAPASAPAAGRGAGRERY